MYITLCRYFFVSFKIFRNRMGLINIHITQGGRRGESSILIIDNKILLLSSFMSRGLWCFKNIYYPMKSSISTSKYWIKTVLFRQNWAVFLPILPFFAVPNLLRQTANWICRQIGNDNDKLESLISAGSETTLSMRRAKPYERRFYVRNCNCTFPMCCAAC